MKINRGKHNILRGCTRFISESLESRCLLSYSPVGPDLTVAASASGVPAIAADSAGDFALVWSAANGPNGQDIFAQRFAAGGVAVGSPFAVNTTTAGDQIDPSIAMDPSGDFVIGWSTATSATASTFSAQAYTANGSANGNQILLANVVNQSGGPQLAIEPDARFEAAWTVGNGAYTTPVIQQYSATGTAIGPAIQVRQDYTGTIIPGIQISSMASDLNGDFGLIWISASDSVSFAEYNSNETAVIAATTLATYSGGVVGTGAGIAIDSAGDTTVTWLSPTGTSAYNCSTQQFHSFGAVKDTIAITGTAALTPTVAMDSAGNFQIAYTTAPLASGAGGQSISTHSFLANGTAVQTFVTSDGGTTIRMSDALAEDGTGNFILASATGSATGGAIRAQVFDTFASTATISGQVWKDVNANGIYDSTEQPVYTCVVNLFNSYGVLISSITSNAFSFSQVMPEQSVYLQVTAPVSLGATPPTGYFLTLLNAGSNPVTNSVIDPATGDSAVLNVAAGQTLAYQNVGLIPSATISVSVFDDLLETGVRDSTDSGINGCVVFIDTNGNGVLDPGEVWVTNNMDGTYGQYTLALLRPGTYPVDLQTQSGWVAPASQSVTITGGQTLAISFSVHTLSAGLAPAISGAAKTITGSATQPTIAADDAGASVVTYIGAFPNNVYFQLFDVNGVAVGSATQVNTATTNSTPAAVGMASDGSFTIVWAGSAGVLGRSYSPTGVAAGAPYVIDGGFIGTEPSIAMNAAGDFAVAWTYRASTTTQVYIRQFGPGGSAPSVPVVVPGSIEPAIDDTLPSIAMRSDASVLVAWQALDSTRTTAIIEAQWFNQAAVATTAAFQVDTSVVGKDFDPSVAINAAGDAAIAWNGEVYSSGNGVYLQRFNSDGTALGNISTVLFSNTSYNIPHISVDGRGDIIGSDNTATGQFTGFDVDVTGATSHFAINSGTSNVVNDYSGISVNSAGDVVIAYCFGTTAFVQRFVALPGVVDDIFQSSNQAGSQFVFRLSEDVTSNLTSAQISVENVTTGLYISAGSLAVTDASDGLVVLSFPGLAGGLLPSGSYLFDLPAADIFTSAGRTPAADFAYRLLWVAATSTGDSVTLRRSPDATAIQVFDQISEGATPSYSAATSTLNQFSITGGSGNDSLTLDFSNGSPTQGTKLTYDGQGGNNSLQCIGAIATSISVVPGSMSIASATVSFANIQNIFVDPGLSTDTLVVSGGSIVQIPAPQTGSGVVAKKLSVLVVAVGSAVHLQNAVASDGSMDHSDRTVLSLSSGITLQGLLDLGDNDLMCSSITGISFKTLNQLVAGGSSGVVGIYSSTAGQDPSHLSTLAVTPSTGASFDGQATNGSTSTLVKYTYYGDSNFDGIVDGSDYTKIDNGFNNHLTGWSNGDFNNDGLINGSDYTLIDNAFNTQTTVLSAQIAAEPSGLIRQTSTTPMPSQIAQRFTFANDLWLDQRKTRKIAD